MTIEELEIELGELMSSLSQTAYCATWVEETLNVCKKIVSGKMKQGNWFWTSAEKERMKEIVSVLGYWVDINMNADNSPYIRTT